MVRIVVSFMELIESDLVDNKLFLVFYFFILIEIDERRRRRRRKTRKEIKREYD